MNLPAIANLLFPMPQPIPIRPMPDMLRDYANSQKCPTRSQDGRYEVFISGQWVDMPESYGEFRELLNRPQI
jgi:hypothetical protein